VRYHDHRPARLAPLGGHPPGRRRPNQADSDRLAFVARRLMSCRRRRPPMPPAGTAARPRPTSWPNRHPTWRPMPLRRRPSTRRSRALNQDADALDAFLDLQHYRLARWRVAGQELGYRRFFDIDDLIGLRWRIPRCSPTPTRLVLQWVRAGEADGLRIDHPDGLRRPSRYLRRLREAAPVGVDRGREDPGGRRVASHRVAGGRHHRLRVPQRRHRSLHRPGRPRRP
jgi:hypothetical protein